LFFLCDRHYDFSEIQNGGKYHGGYSDFCEKPLSKKKYFDPVEFKNQTFIVLSPDENNYVSSGPTVFCQQNGFLPEILYAPNLDSATLMVECGLGVSFSYSKSVGSYNPSMKFLPLKEGLTMTRCPKLVLAWNDTLDNLSAELFVGEFELPNTPFNLFSHK